MASLAELLDYDNKKKQALSALQAGADVINRGSIAGTLGAPVDLANMALGAVGLGSENPVLGSEWIGQKMQKAGMVSPERRPLAEFAAGFVNPETAATKGALLAKALASKSAPLHAMFIGARSAKWNPEMAATAKELEAKGVSPQEIWEQTGTWKGPDKQWRQEISDKDAKFNTALDISIKAQEEKDRIAAMLQQSKDISKGLKTQPDLFEKELKAWSKKNKEEAMFARDQMERYYGLTSNPRYTGNFAEIAYEHPGLYSAYPDLAKAVVYQGNPGDFIGAYTPGRSGSVGHLELSPMAFGKGKSPESTAAHEMQHAIQEIEGFGSGGSPESFMNIKASKQRLLQLIENSTDFAKAMEKQNDLNNRIMSAPSISDNPYEISQHFHDEQDALEKNYPILNEWRKLKTEYNSLQNMTPLEGYKNLAGEAEARATQSRLNLTPEQRRKTFPESSYDVPINNLIF